MERSTYLAITHHWQTLCNASTSMPDIIAKTCTFNMNDTGRRRHLTAASRHYNYVSANVCITMKNGTKPKTRKSENSN